MMTISYLPAIPAGSDEKALTQFDQGLSEVGSGSGTGETYLKVDDRTGRMTFGPDQTELPPGMKFAVPMQGFRHGYINMDGGRVVERNVIPLMGGPRPKPASGYGTFSGGGPRNVDEICLFCVDEAGFVLTFTAWGVSSANRLRTLGQEISAHTKTADGQKGFIHPVIIPRAGSFQLQARALPDGTDIPARKLFHFDYDVVDWLHRDGKTFLIKQAKPAAEQAPWDDDMSDAERDLLGAAE